MYEITYENKSKMFLEPEAAHHGDTLAWNVIVDSFGSGGRKDVDGTFILRSAYDEGYSIQVFLFNREDLDKDLVKIDTILDQLATFRDELYTKGNEYLSSKEEKDNARNSSEEVAEDSEA